MSPHNDEEPLRPWHVVAEKVVYEHWPWLRLKEQTVELPNGRRIERYLVSEGPDVVMIFAVTEKGEVVFVEQYKHGMGEMSLDLSAGYMDEEDPSPLAAAQRELEEETGFQSDQWRFLVSLATSPNRSPAKLHYFLAVDCRPTGRQHFDPTEDLRVRLYPLAEVEDMILDGRVRTISSVAGIALGLLALRRG